MTIIPTYDTDVLGYWVAENEELLTELKIDLAPSASRCTINLQGRHQGWETWLERFGDWLGESLAR